jgi:histidinol phosphatase-like enzyme
MTIAGERGSSRPGILFDRDGTIIVDSGHADRGYFRDIGTPEAYGQASEEWPALGAG